MSSSKRICPVPTIGGLLMFHHHHSYRELTIRHFSSQWLRRTLYRGMMTRPVRMQCRRPPADKNKFHTRHSALRVFERHLRGGHPSQFFRDDLQPADMSGPGFCCFQSAAQPSLPATGPLMKWSSLSRRCCWLTNSEPRIALLLGTGQFDPALRRHRITTACASSSAAR